jgi:hypothetical protein
VPAWSKTGGKVFVFPSEKSIPIKQRTHKSGLCYIHAPEVIQYYLVASQNASTETGMIDMSKMIRKCWEERSLDSHIFENAGGNSPRMLRKILHPNSLVVPTTKPETQLKKYGPALVSGFVVHEDFLEHRHSYDTAPTGAVVGHHAMVIIGWRRDQNNKLWYLVQNWWDSKRFVQSSI